MVVHIALIVGLVSIVKIIENKFGGYKINTYICRMEKDTKITDITFRKFKDGQVIALMPHEVDDMLGNVNCYMHVGQHSTADYNHIIATTKLATPREYADLLNELEKGFGYNIKVVSKRNYKKYLASYYEARA